MWCGFYIVKFSEKDMVAILHAVEAATKRQGFKQDVNWGFSELLESASSQTDCVKATCSASAHSSASHIVHHTSHESGDNYSMARLNVFLFSL